MLWVFKINFRGFRRFLIHGNSSYVVLYTQCLRYNICSAWFLDIRISTCFYRGIGLQVDPQGNPKLFKARTIPFFLKDKVEAELEKLQSLGIIIPVKHSIVGLHQLTQS